MPWRFCRFCFSAVLPLSLGKMLYDQDVNGLDISAIPSALIGTKAPALSLPPLEGSNPLTPQRGRRQG